MTSSDPIFKAIFGADWERLPPVMRLHYDVRPRSNDTVVAEGVMDVRCARYLRPLLRLIGVLPPCSKTDVPVTVIFSASPSEDAFRFGRTFFFRRRPPFHFHSEMTQTKGNVIRERMRYGLCWQAAYAWTGEEVRLNHRGYAWRIGSFTVPLPLTLLLGRTDATEQPIDARTFRMRAAVTHPLFGVVYAYQGRFTLTKVT